MPFELVRPGTQIDFLGKAKVCLVISVALILIGLVSIPLRGFRLGIDFAGGTELHVSFPENEAVDEGDVRAVVQGLGIAGASVIRFGGGGSNEFLIKYASEVEDEALPDVAAEPGGEGEAATVEAADPGVEVAEAAPAAEEPVAPVESELEPPAAAARAAQADEGTVPLVRQQVNQVIASLEQRIGPVELERVDFVGPKVGAELRRAGILALVVACGLILLYIAIRFSTRFAPGAVVALVHDVLVTSGLWVIFGLEFDLRVLAALLAIVGYSLNDTIIVYDRIRENMELRTRANLESVLNEAVNQTLARTLLTSATTLVAVLSLLFLGGEVIRPFALAMAIGIGVGTYSSIFVAAPTLLFLERRFGASPATARA